MEGRKGEREAEGGGKEEKTKGGWSELEIQTQFILIKRKTFMVIHLHEMVKYYM